MLGENVHHYGRGIPRRFHGRYEELISPEVRALLTEADVLIGNFECTLLPDREWSDARLDKAIYSAPESSLSLLDSLSPIKIVNIANNHFMQHGLGRAKATIARLQERGIVVAGADFNPAVVTWHGQYLRIWGVSVAHDAHGDDGGYAHCSPVDLPGALLQTSKKSSGDRWIISIHWGEEYRSWPSPTQQALAQRLADVGFDLVHGHHPHVVQPVVRMNDCWVAYSHGNMIFDQNFSTPTQNGLIMRTALGNEDPSLYMTRSRNYRVDRYRKMSRTQLEIYCRRRDSRMSPLRMRVKMKLELLRHAHESNRETFRYFLHKLWN